MRHTISSKASVESRCWERAAQTASPVPLAVVHQSDESLSGEHVVTGVQRGFLETSTVRDTVCWMPLPPHDVAIKQYAMVRAADIRNVDLK
jgi:hypothetical protein